MTEQLARKKKPSKLSSFAVTQYLDPKYFPGWSQGELDVLAHGDVRLIGYLLATRIEQAIGSELKGFWIILHDKDTNDVWDESVADYVKEPKALHFHAVGQFADDSKQTLEAIASYLGVEAQYVEKPKSGRFSLTNMLAYLTHQKHADKYHYEPSEVATIRGESYLDIYTANKAQWERGRAVVSAQNAKDPENVEPLLESILSGSMTRERLMLNSNLVRIYSKNRRVIDDAFIAASNHRMAVALDKFNRGEYKTEVVFITGNPGSGKSYFATNVLIPWLQKRGALAGERWLVGHAAGANALDDYAGEEILLMDDLRASAMNATEWLRLLDPEHANAAAARYANKSSVAPRYIIITSHQDPVEFFHYARGTGSEDEPMNQFIRRISWCVTVMRVADVHTFEFLQIGERASHSWRRMVGGGMNPAGRTDYNLEYGPIARSGRLTTKDLENESDPLGAIEGRVSEFASKRDGESWSYPDLEEKVSIPVSLSDGVEANDLMNVLFRVIGVSKELSRIESAVRRGFPEGSDLRDSTSYNLLTSMLRNFKSIGSSLSSLTDWIESLRKPEPEPRSLSASERLVIEQMFSDVLRDLD